MKYEGEISGLQRCLERAQDYKVKFAFCFPSLVALLYMRVCSSAICLIFITGQPDYTYNSHRADGQR